MWLNCNWIRRKTCWPRVIVSVYSRRGMWTWSIVFPTNWAPEVKRSRHGVAWSSGRQSHTMMVSRRRCKCVHSLLFVVSVINAFVKFKNVNLLFSFSSASRYPGNLQEIVDVVSRVRRIGVVCAREEFSERYTDIFSASWWGKAYSLGAIGCSRQRVFTAGKISFLFILHCY